MQKEISCRKNPRIPGYDYAQNGAYFVTICTHDRMPVLSQIINDETIPQIILTEIGHEINKSIQHIDKNYENVNVTKYVIMPNHVHMIVLLQSSNKGDDKNNTPLQNIIWQFKSFTTKRYYDIHETQCDKLWQRSFYDRIIRYEREYLDVWRYIDTNPVKWQLDEYHCNE